MSLRAQQIDRINRKKIQFADERLNYNHTEAEHGTWMNRNNPDENILSVPFNKGIISYCVIEI